MKTHSQCGLIRTNFYNGNKNASALLMKRRRRRRASWHRRRDERDWNGRTTDERTGISAFTVFTCFIGAAPDSFRFAPRATSSNRRWEGEGDGWMAAHLSGVLCPLDWIIGRRRRRSSRSSGSSNGALGGRNVFTASHRGTALHCAGTGCGLTRGRLPLLILPLFAFLVQAPFPSSFLPPQQPFYSHDL